MKIKQIKCPNCGANLDIKDETIKKMKCDYCNSTFTYSPDEDEIKYTEAESNRAKNSADEYEAKAKYEAIKQSSEIFNKVQKASKLPIIIFAIFFVAILGFGIYMAVQGEEEHQAFKFNMNYNDGTQTGIIVKYNLGEIISSNNENTKHQITVVYGSIETSDKDKIKEIRNSLNDWDKYDIVFQKDKKGYIIKYIIENV